jgi:pyruvate formate lyase activating enzyme
MPSVTAGQQTGLSPQRSGLPRPRPLLAPPAGLVFDIQRFSIHDGPGIRTTVFLKGCPLHCGWCHNPESQLPGREMMVWARRCIGCEACLAACPRGAISLDGGTIVTDPALCDACGACVEECYAGAREIVGRERTVAEVMAVIERDVPFYDQSGGGVTVSGGEPLMQPGFLLALLQACQARYIHTTLDTCGFAPWTALDRVRPYVDLFLYDVKLMDPHRHRQWTGRSNERILGNLEALSRHGHRIAMRLPILPGVNDDGENVAQTAAFAAGLPHLERVDLLPYHPMAADKYERLHRAYSLPGMQPPSAEAMAAIAGVFSRYGLRVQVGG